LIGREARSGGLFWIVALSGLLAPALLSDLKLPDEPRVAHTSLEMLRTGDFVLPTVNGKPFLQTPPLHYWTLAGWFAMAGCEPDGLARVPSVLLSLATIAITARIGRRFLDERAALLAAGILAGTIGFWDAGQRVVVDASLALFVTVGFHHMAVAVDALDISVRRGAWLGAAAGLAFLAKGLPGPVILGSVACVALATERALWRRELVAFATAAALAFAVVALPWTVALWRRDPGFVDELLFAHVKARFLEGAHHDPSNFTFIHRSLLKLLPWGAALPFALAYVWKRALRAKAAPPSAPAPSRAFARLVLLWLVIPFVLLLLSRSKRNLYLLPIFPAAALACAAWLVRLLGRGHSRRLVLAVVWAPVLLLPIAGAMYQRLDADDVSMAAFGRGLADVEKSGRTVVGFRLEEREEAAIAWYLRHPFESLGDASALRDRVAALGAKAVLAGDADDLREAGVGAGEGRHEILEHVMRRRRVVALEELAR
jgi:4-amino-4-deoxy-L-arabinose transferase-like glycosyltransferase